MLSPRQKIQRNLILCLKRVSPTALSRPKGVSLVRSRLCAAIGRQVRFLLEAAMLSQTLRLRGALATALYGSVVLVASVASADNFDVLNYVDPLIGTANGGAKS